MLANREGQIKRFNEKIDTSHSFGGFLINLLVFLKYRRIRYDNNYTSIFVYRHSWIVCGEKIFAATGDEIFYHPGDIFVPEVLHGVPTKDQVIALANFLCNNVMNLKLT